MSKKEKSMTVPPSIKAEAEAAAEAESQFCHCGGHTICYGCEAETKELILKGWQQCFTRLMQLSEGEFPKDTNVEYSDEAKAFVAKCFPCEPPCDSYGVCSNCAEETTFGAGYNLGARHQHSLDMAALLKAKEEIAAHKLASENLSAECSVLHRKLGAAKTLDALLSENGEVVALSDELEAERAKCSRLERALREVSEGRGFVKGEEPWEVLHARQALSGDAE